MDGEELADLMFEHDLEVTTTSTHELKRVDSDLFDEEYAEGALAVLGNSS